MKDFIFLLLQFAISTVQAEEVRHGTKILQQPRDVTDVRCGDDIEMTCLATTDTFAKVNGSQVPDIEWWIRNSGSIYPSAEKILKTKRVSIKTEIFMVVQSTLAIRSANSLDEGVYQCRSSASPQRYTEGVNVYQHWKIEEAPITNVKCQQDQTSTTSLFVSTSSRITTSTPPLTSSVSSLQSTPTTTLAIKKRTNSKRRTIKRQPKRSSHPDNMKNYSSGFNGVTNSMFAAIVSFVSGYFLRIT